MTTARESRPAGHRLLLGTMLLWFAGLLVSIPAAAADCPGADAEALELLNRMSRALHDLSFRGVATLQRGEDMQVMRVTHSVDDGMVTEHLTQLTGNGSGFTREEHPLNCVHPGHALLRLGARTSADDCGLARYYRVRAVPGDLVAGHPSVRLVVEPRDMYRFGYVLELDRETGLLLGMQTLGRGGKVLERFQFASLERSDEQKDLARQEHLQPVSHPHPDSDTHVDTEDRVARSWSVSWLPAGFVATDAARGEIRRRSYTDGLAVMSVFMETLSRDIRPGEGVSRRGGTVSYTRGLILAGDPVLVTVLGEVPLNTARMVADSIRWAE